MIGITEIGSYIPSKKISNIKRKNKFNIDEDFIFNKIEIVNVSAKGTDV
ncbi:MAG: hypothetical protein ABJA35_02020 [Parafilimonas sp.]